MYAATCEGAAQSCHLCNSLLQLGLSGCGGDAQDVVKLLVWDQDVWLWVSAPLNGESEVLAEWVELSPSSL